MSDAKTPFSEAIENVLCINLHKIPKFVAAVDAKRSGIDLYKTLDGAVLITKSTIQIGFPLAKVLEYGGGIRTAQIQFKHPAIPPHDSIPIFAITYNNYGTSRALSLLAKKFCTQSADRNGICWFPCFPKGWRQTCTLGTRFQFIRRAYSGTSITLETPMAEASSLSASSFASSSSFSYTNETSDDDLMIEYTDNVLQMPAGFCNSNKNPGLKFARRQEVCNESHLNLTMKTDEARMTTENCNEVNSDQRLDMNMNMII